MNDNICVQCHAEPKILQSKYTSEEIHLNHVSTHKVECFRCHATINHFIPRPEGSPLSGKKQVKKAGLSGYHYDSNCIKCHDMDEHTAKRNMFMGKGTKDLADLPSPMFLAHLDCASCHIALSDSNGITKGIKRNGFKDIIQSCNDCHGPGYDDMAKHWKKLLTAESDKTEKSLLKARNTLMAYKNDGRFSQVSQLLALAERNLQFTNDGRGLHNIDYALKLLTDSQGKIEEALAMVVPKYVTKKITSPTGCTELCHNCVECIETKPVPFGNVQFPHDVHVSDEGLACLDCHTPRERHGHTLMKGCSSCHHGSGMGSVLCEDCHIATFNLFKGQNACDEISCDIRGTANPMSKKVTCQECHTQVAEEKETTLAGIKQTCIECHDDSYGPMVDDWKTKVEALKVDSLYKELQATQKMVLFAIKNGQYTYDIQDLINNAEKNLKQLRQGNPIHNLTFSQNLAAKIRTLLDKAQKKLQRHSTIETLEAGEYK